MQRVNGWLTLFWIILVPISFITGWVDETRYVSALSLVALILGSWSAWQAARVEVKQDKMEREQKKNRESDEDS